MYNVVGTKYHNQPNNFCIVLYRYNANLGKAKKFAVKKGAVSGVAMGFVMFIVGLSYALGFWAGSRIVLGAELTLPHLHEDFTVGNMLIVSYCGWTFGEEGGYS